MSQDPRTPPADARPESSEAYERAVEALRGLDPEDRRRAFATLRREREEQAVEQVQKMALLPNSNWSRASVLRRLSNPTREAYEQKIHIPELTFVGTANQPDFGEVLLTFYPAAWTVELKSLKQYKDEFRNTVASYERLANVMFEDLMMVYEPQRLRLLMRLRPRGGISSCLTIDSDWKIRGGREEFTDWVDNTDRFGFEVHGSTPLW
jgi:7-cyano-7-deazaguanine reductase